METGRLGDGGIGLMQAGIFLSHQHKCVMSIPLKYCDPDPISLSSCAIPGTHFDILGPVDALCLR